MRLRLSRKLWRSARCSRETLSLITCGVKWNEGGHVIRSTDSQHDLQTTGYIRCNASIHACALTPEKQRIRLRLAPVRCGESATAPLMTSPPGEIERRRREEDQKKLATRGHTEPVWAKTTGHGDDDPGRPEMAEDAGGGGRRSACLSPLVHWPRFGASARAIHASAEDGIARAPAARLVAGQLIPDSLFSITAQLSCQALHADIQSVRVDDERGRRWHALSETESLWFVGSSGHTAYTQHMVVRTPEQLA
jgi:hypothetical protein